MYHSIKFDDKDCFNDFHLIPNGRPHVPPPPVRTKVIELPGSNGDLDLTTSLTGYPLYGNREGTFDFMVTHDYDGYKWSELYSQLLKFFHGQRRKVILEDDPDYYYVGRCTLDDWTEERPYNTVSISYVFEPYKWNNKTNVEQYPEVTWEQTINGEMPSIFGNLADYLEDAPVNPILKVETRQQTAELTFVNEELGINVDTILPAISQRCPLFTMTNITGTNTIKLGAKTDCKLTLNFRNGKL